MKVMNNFDNESKEEVGGLLACILGCGVFCFGTSGAGTVVASATYML